MNAKQSKVYLVGAGPGDAMLITRRGFACIQKADYIIYDRLVNQALLEAAPVGCQFHYVGKAAGRHYLPQEEITELIVRCAQAGGNVVRLKGGDPYVFGRGGEEALRLAELGLPFEVVPGISSSIGGLCYAGFPITHRELARSFHVVTAHTNSHGMEQARLNVLAQEDGTLVFLMGLSQVRTICQGLIQAGKPAETPAAVVSHATTVRQRTVVGTLASLADAVERAKLTSPAIIVVGEVVTLRDQLNFFETRPLFGRTFLVTRTSSKSGGLQALLEEQGAAVLHAPMLELKPVPHALDAAMAKIEQFTHIVFTSQVTVAQFFAALDAVGKDARALHNAKLCVIGSATAQALRQYGLRADIIPARFTAEGLCEALLPQLTASNHVLLPQSAAARPVLRETLQHCCSVTAVALYTSEAADCDVAVVQAKLCAGDIDGITFTSSAAVRHFADSVGFATVIAQKIPVYSIGTVTSQTLKTYGVVPVTSEESTMQSLTQTILKQYQVR